MNNYFLKILFIICFLFVNNGNPFLFYQYQETNNEIFKTDVNEWQKMKPIIMKDYNLQVNNFNTIKEAIKLEMLDIWIGYNKLDHNYIDFKIIKKEGI